MENETFNVKGDMMPETERFETRLQFDKPYKRFLDRLIKKIKAAGTVINEGDYPKLCEYAITVLALRDFQLVSPRRIPSRGGARPGAGRPKKPPQDAPGEPNKPDP